VIAALEHYLTLCKLRVVSLITLTAVIGIILAPGTTTIWHACNALIGITVAACAGAVFNHVADRALDAKMKRTQHRPLVQGAISIKNAFYFGIVLTSLSMLLLIISTNTLTACLTFASLIGYAFIYTVMLKPSTPQNIVIGGLSGALPPLLGWTAVTGTLHYQPWLLVLIIFTWTPPHFWALSIARIDDYRKANIPVLPVTHGIDYCKFQIFLYAILTTLATLLPYTTNLVGILYLTGCGLLNSIWLAWAWRLYRHNNPKDPMRFFWYSIVYLALLFLFMLLDHYISAATI
jgi:heme o synthase